ncbi:MAG: (d)CMP kinase [Peptostreptococcaceae bacterium]|nr:(d)CMP kinase [Peptostreptococcaceae bacterium]
MLYNETLIRVAIDGPGGAGKSTIAKLVAKDLGIDYIDTGAMYRAIGLKLIRNNINIDDEEELEKVLMNTEIDFNEGCIYLDGIDVSNQIRTSEISMIASDCSKKKLVREKLVLFQREIGMRKSVVMDGRDIGTNVLKDAEIKIFLTADSAIRAKRRYNELLEKGENPDYNEVLNDIVKRDYQDSNRELNPLKQATDAILIDTSNMNIEEVAACIKGYIKKI